MLDPSLLFVPLFPCDFLLPQVLPKILEIRFKLKEQALKSSWGLGFRVEGLEAEEDTLNLKFKGLNMEEPLKDLVLGMQLLPRRSLLFPHRGSCPDTRSMH